MITRRDFLKLSGILAFVLPQMGPLEIIDSIPQPKMPSFLEFDDKTITTDSLDDIPPFTAEFWIKGDTHIGNKSAEDLGWIHVTLPIEQDRMDEWQHNALFYSPHDSPRKISPMGRWRIQRDILS